jgi:RNA polymerase sigma factor (sigma-70 family)
MSDHELIREYVRSGSQEAFAELVRRHAGWVHCAAVRRVRDGSLAEDVTQAVFIVLARKGGTIREHTAMTAWLFGVLRLAAARAMRTERRRRRHEQIAAAKNAAATTRTDSEEVSPEEWERVSAVLDRSVERLRGKDRLAILLRFYQRFSYAEVGAALGGVTEEAARKRVARAVERLRDGLARRGVDWPTSRLGTALWALTAPPAALQTPPAAIAAAADSAARGASAASSSMSQPIAIAKGAIRMKTLASLKIPAALAALTVTAATALAMIHRPSAGIQAGNPPVATTTRAIAMTDPAAGGPAAAADDKNSDDKKPDPNSPLNKKIPSVRFGSPMAADLAIVFFQDVSGTTITVDWKKLGISGDKAIQLNLNQPTLGEALAALVSAAGAKEKPEMKAEGKAITVTAPAKDAKDKEKAAGA